MASGKVHLSGAEARDLAEGALRGVGYDHEEARIIAAARAPGATVEAIKAAFRG